MNRYIKKILYAILGTFLGMVALLIFSPSEISPESWQASVFQGYSGAHEVNQKLSNLKHIDLNGELGPEHIALGPDGKIYAATVSGAIIRFNETGEKVETWIKTGGRVLGFAFDQAGNMIAADAMRGLLKIDPSGRLETLLDSIHGKPLMYANSIIVSSNGKIYFTESSTRFTPRDTNSTFKSSILDIFEHSATGRVIEFDPQSKATRIVAQGLAFANGIALSGDEKSLFIAETGEYRIWKLSLDQSNLNLRSPNQEAHARVVISNLPGFPDNLMRGEDGKIWVGLTKPRSKLIDRLADKPALRKIVMKLPQKLWPVPPAYGHVLAINESGQVQLDLQDPSGRYPETSGVTETKHYLFIHSLHATTIGVFKK